MKYGLIIVVVTVIAACATSPGPTETSSADGSQMLGLGEEPEQPIWEEWEVQHMQALPPRPLESMDAFDYWTIREASFIESNWAALSTLLDAVRRQTNDAAVRDSATLMLEALEPGDEHVQVDVTFYSSSRREGLALRMVSNIEPGSSPSLAVLMNRPAGGSSRPDRISVSAAPGYVEPSPFNVLMRRDETGWRVSLSRGRREQETFDAQRLADAGLYAEVFTEQLWAPLSGTNYADATLKAGGGDPLPEPHRPALGLDVDDRSIDRVFSNSAFTPRMDDFSPDDHTR